MRRRRILRIVKWTALVLGLLIVIGIGTVLAVLHTDWGREQIRSDEARGGRLLFGRSVQGARVDPGAGVERSELAQPVLGATRTRAG